jgi:hypothetical protein
MSEAISGDFVVAVLGLDVVSQKASRFCTGVGDQSLFFREGQPKLGVEELREEPLDLFRFSAGADKPKKGIIGVPNVHQSAKVRIMWISRGKLLGLPQERLSLLILFVLAGKGLLVCVSGIGRIALTGFASREAWEEFRFDKTIKFGKTRYCSGVGRQYRPGVHRSALGGSAILQDILPVKGV